MGYDELVFCGAATERSFLPWLFVDVADAMGIVGDGRERRDGAGAGGRLGFEASADWEIGIEAKGAKDLPLVAVRREVQNVGLAALRNSEIDRILA